jgi:hypothetical protein
MGMPKQVHRPRTCFEDVVIVDEVHVESLSYTAYWIPTNYSRSAKRHGASSK